MDPKSGWSPRTRLWQGPTCGTALDFSCLAVRQARGLGEGWIDGALRRCMPGVKSMASKPEFWAVEPGLGKGHGSGWTQTLRELSKCSDQLVRRGFRPFSHALAAAELRN